MVTVSDHPSPSRLTNDDLVALMLPEIREARLEWSFRKFIPLSVWEAGLAPKLVRLVECP